MRVLGKIWLVRRLPLGLTMPYCIVRELDGGLESRDLGVTPRLSRQSRLMGMGMGMTPESKGNEGWGNT